MFDESTLKKITPILVEVAKRTNERSIVSVWKEQVKIHVIRNVLYLPIIYPKGEYELSFGFYLTDEVYQKYPPQYMKRFKIEII